MSKYKYLSDESKLELLKSVYLDAKRNDEDTEIIIVEAKIVQARLLNNYYVANLGAKNE